MPEAILYTTEKPDNAGGPVEGSRHTWKPVYAGGLIVSIREARQSGRPCDKYTVKNGSRCMSEALLKTIGKPDNAGGPLK